MGFGLVAVFTVVKLLVPALGRDIPFVLYFGAPLVAALLGGRRPGLVTAGLAAIVAHTLFLRGSGDPLVTVKSVAQTLAFFVEAVAVTLVCDALLRAHAHRAQLFLSERAAREVVEREQRRFRSIFDLSLEGYLLFDDEHRITDANPAARALLARSREALVGLSLLELFVPYDGAAEAFGAGGVMANAERGLVLPDGTLRLVEASAVAKVLPGLHLLSFRDVDDRKRAELALRFLADAGRILASSLDYRETLAAVVKLVVPTMADWAAVDIVDGGTRSLRRVAVAHVDEAKIELARRLYEIRPPSLDAPTGVAQVIRTGEPQLMELVTDEMLVHGLADQPEALDILRQVGLVSFIIVPLPVRGASWGAITLCSAESRRRFTQRDVAFAQELARRAGSAIEIALAHAERVRAAEAERDEQIRTRNRSERLYRLTSALAATMTTDALAEHVCDLAAHAVGSDSATLFVEDEARTALVLLSKHGQRDDIDAFGRIALDAAVPVARIVHDRRPRFFESLEDVVAEAPSLRAPLSGNPFRAWALLPLEGGARQILGVLSFSFRSPRSFSEEDRQLMSAVAAQCAVALDRARAYEAEAAALRKKDEFLAMLGHELRNPLAPILTATHLIRLRGTASERELGILERQGQHLVRLVDDLLDVSRITSGKLALKRAPIEVAEVIAQALESASKVLEDKRLRLHVDVPREGMVVDGDRERLVQVLTNLLVNAAKFTPAEKRVSVTASAHDGRAVIEVRDEGEGIEPDLLPHVFDPFTQGRQSSDRSGGGLGLGLAIARSIVVAHAGAIAADSRGLGAGTTITVTLPILDRPSPVAPARRDGGLDGQRPAGTRRILIVDDNVDGAEMLAEFFDQLGYETIVANDGPQALHFAGDLPPDAAVLDIGLPGMDGYELATELRSRFGERTPVLVALTGYAQASDRERALTSGFSAHLGKPIDVTRLAETLTSLLGSGPASN